MNKCLEQVGVVVQPPPVNFSWDRISSLLVGAIEGGSNYWYMIEDHNLDEIKDCEFLSMLPAYEGGYWKISDAGAYDDPQDPEREIKRGKLVNRKVLKKGLEIMAKNYPIHFENFRSQSDDADTSDIFLQCCVFGKTVYG